LNDHLYARRTPVPSSKTAHVAGSEPRGANTAALGEEFVRWRRGGGADERSVRKKKKGEPSISPEKVPAFSNKKKLLAVHSAKGGHAGDGKRRKFGKKEFGDAVGKKRRLSRSRQGKRFALPAKEESRRGLSAAEGKK